MFVYFTTKIKLSKKEIWFHAQNNYTLIFDIDSLELDTILYGAVDIRLSTVLFAILFISHINNILIQPILFILAEVWCSSSIPLHHFTQTPPASLAKTASILKKEFGHLPELPTDYLLSTVRYKHGFFTLLLTDIGYIVATVEEDNIICFLYLIKEAQMPIHG